MDALPKLEIISNFGVGVDAIDLDAAKQRRIIVTNTPDVLNDCVADTAMALTVNVMRRFPQAEVYLRAGSWAAKGAYPLTTSLGGKTMGILGLGRIGEAVAKRAMACGMKIRYHNRNKKDVPYPYDPDPVTLAKNSDVLMVITPGGPETSKLVNAKVLDAPGRAAEFSPITHAANGRAPFLIAWGEHDFLRTRRQGPAMAEALRRHGARVGAMELAGDNHFDTSIRAANAYSDWVRAALDLIAADRLPA